MPCLRTVHHTGSSWGFRTVVKRFVEPDLAIAIACNDDNSWPRRLAWQIAEQEQPLVIVPIADDRFEFRMGWQMVVLDFDRNRAGVITGFGLSAGSERGIVFENFSGGGR